MNKRPLNPNSPATRTDNAHIQPATMAAILCLALLARMGAIWNFLTHRGAHWLYGHPIEMGLIADSLLHGHGYSSVFGPGSGPTAIVAPGYPTFVALVFYLFGSFTTASAVAILFVHGIVSVLTVWMIMRIAAEYMDVRGGVLAGTFWAVSLPLLWIPTIFWETTFSAFALPAMLALALGCRKAPTRGRWILFGSACSISALVNPALLPSLLLVMGWVAYHTRKTGWKHAALGFIACAVVFAPWPVRNAVQFHAFIPLRSTVGLEMYMGNHPGADGRLDDSLFPMYNKLELASYYAKGEVRYTADKNRQAWSYIRSQPGTFVRLTLRRVYRFWSGTGTLPRAPIYEDHAILTTLFGFAGLILLVLNGKGDIAVLIALPLLLFPVPYYITHAEFRYRLNIDPVLTMLGGYAVSQFAAMFARHRARTSSAVLAPPMIIAGVE